MGKTRLSGSNETEVTDELDIRLNGETAGVWPSVPDMPGDDGSEDEWREYAVAMGLDPTVAKEWDTEKIMDWLGGPAPVAEGSDQHYGEQAIEEQQVAGDEVQPDEPNDE
jgi:hypothetical protein